MKKFVIFILFYTGVFNYAQSIWECTSGVTVQLNSCSNSKNGYWGMQGWACGDNGTIIRGSTNGCGTWTNLTGHGVPTNVNLNNICAVDLYNAFVCGTLNSITYLWKTTNAGLNWTQIFSQTNGFINAVYMRNPMNGFMEGNPVNGRWSLWKTSNGGINWDSSGMYLQQAGSELGWSNSLCNPIINWSNPDSSKIWFGTNNFRIYYSSNYGLNWAAQSTSTEQNSFCINYGIEISPILYAGGSNYLLTSTNYGTNWSTISVGGSGNIVGVAQTMSTFFARGNKIYSHNGTNWYNSFTAPTGTYTYVDNRSFSQNPIDHFGVRTGGGLTFFVDMEGVRKISDETPSSFSLSQNYPNPFNPSTKINYAITKAGMVELKVFDATGHQVALLVNELQTPGTYEAEFGGRAYASGVYFYQLTIHDDASAPFSITRKMVLVK